MKVIKGDLIQLALNGEFDVIVHGCNCKRTMGAGIARTIRDMFPQAYNIDMKTGDSKEKLGIISAAIAHGHEGHIFTIVNGYTQEHPRPPVCTDAIRSVFEIVKKRFAGQRIGYPKIGAGLGGGDWNEISKIINEELEGEDHTLVEFVR